jgi:hypothetical protein
MLGRAVHIGAQIQHRGGAALGVGHLRGNGRAVNAVQRLEQVARNGHQRAGVASRHRSLRRAVLDLLDGHAHGRILLAAQRHLDRIIHGHHLRGRDRGALMRERLQASGCPTSSRRASV